MTAVVAGGLIGWVGVGPASASTSPPVTSGSAAVLAESQSAHRANASPQDYQFAVTAYVSLVRTGVKESAPGAGTVQPDWKICRSISKAPIVAFAWEAIIQQGSTAVVGGFLDATVVGMPVGGVLSAIGIGYGTTGTALLYWADHTSWPKTVCVKAGW